MRSAVIVAATRTPIGKRNGVLAGIHPVDLSACVLKDLQHRVGLDPNEVDDVIWGCVGAIGEQSANIGRQAVLAAGWPVSVPGVTLDRQCGSSQQSVHFAAASIQAGMADIVVAGGVESLTRVPLGSARRAGDAIGHTVLNRFGVSEFNQGLSADLISSQYGLSREALDEYALNSHKRAAAAEDRGVTQAQMAELSAVGEGMQADEGIRRNSNILALRELPPAFQLGGTTTAGNTSQLSDGASAVLIVAEEIAAAHGWKPLARVVASAAVGDDPVEMLTAPIPATRKVLERAGLSLDDIDVFEVNEAFAAVPLMWMRQLGVDISKVNVEGGAIALGHPLGASGTILMTRLVDILFRHDHQYGLQVMCEFGGTANATVIERL